MLFLLGGNVLILAAGLVGCAGAVVLLLGRRVRVRLIAVVGFVAALLGFGLLLSVTLSEVAARRLNALSARVLGVSYGGLESWQQVQAGAESLAASGMTALEFADFLDRWGGGGSSGGTLAVRAVTDLIRTNRLPDTYHETFADWLIKNYPTWLASRGSEEDAIPALLTGGRLSPAKQLAIIDLLISASEDVNQPFAYGWTRALDEMVLSGSIDADRIERYMVGRMLCGVTLEKFSECRPGELVPVLLDRPSNTGSMNVNPRNSSLPWRCRARVIAPDTGAHDAGVDVADRYGTTDLQILDRIGRVRAPESPGPYQIETEFVFSLRRDDLWQFFDWNPHLLPAGVRIHHLKDLTARRVVKVAGRVSGDPIPSVSLLSDADTTQKMQEFVEGRSKSFYALQAQRRGSAAGMRAFIHIRGGYVLSVAISHPPVDAAFDVWLDMNGEERKVGWLCAPATGSDRLNVTLPRFDWKTVTPSLVLRPSTSQVEQTRGLTGLYAGPEIRFELDVLVEWDD